MRFEAVILGGGLAGLAAALRLQGEGCACALVNAGQSALHFSSGAFDFLNFMPDGSPVEKPAERLQELISLEPAHPYALLGKERTLELAGMAEKLLEDWGISMSGSLDGNHYRITPLGNLHPAWLSSPDVYARGRDRETAWEKVLLASIEGFLDFYPEILADNLASIGIASDCFYLTIPALETLRQNPSEFRSVNISRVLDISENFAAFAERLAEAARDFEAVLLPACMGQNDFTLMERFSRKVGKPVKLVPTLPPSLLGARIGRLLAERFVSLGGIYMPGDRAVGYALERDRIARIYTVNHEDIAIESGHYILASGSFFSQGLRSDQNGVREPVFNLDLTDVPPDRREWTAKSVFDPQPYSRFGVRADGEMRVFMNGRLVPNLYAAGMVLGGYDAVRLGCGAGVALTTGLAAAESILKERGAA